MKYFYENEAECNDQKMVAYFESVNAFIVGSFSQNGIKTLPKLQTGLVPWIQDEKAHKILRSDSPVSGSVSQSDVILFYMLIISRCGLCGTTFVASY
jgi:hypothetical protein